MSDTLKLSELLKALPAASDTAGKSVVLTDASGAMSKMGIGSLRCKNLAGKEPAGTTIDVREFTSKYIKAGDVGSIISEQNYAHATTWFLKINNLCLNMQSYAILVTKYTNTLNVPWGTVCFVMIPTIANADDAIYFVTQSVGASSSDYSVNVRKIAITKV